MRRTRLDAHDPDAGGVLTQRSLADSAAAMHSAQVVVLVVDGVRCPVWRRRDFSCTGTAVFMRPGKGWGTNATLSQAAVRMYASQWSQRQRDPVAFVKQMQAFFPPPPLAPCRVSEHGEGLTHRELMLANDVILHGRALLIAANKMDALGREARAGVLGLLRRSLDRGLPAGASVRLLPMSALRADVAGLLPAVHEVYRLWNLRISTGRLNRFVAGVSWGREGCRRVGWVGLG